MPTSAHREDCSGLSEAAGISCDNPGWLEIPDTSVSYPVMQRDGDWQYYLHRDFDVNYSFYGTPFLDWRCSPDSDNLIIYGHNINGRRLFGALHAYADKDYYKEHPQVNLRLGDETHSFQILSVIQTDTRAAVYSFTDTGNMEEYRDDVKEILSRSLYRTEMAETVKQEMKRLPEEEFFKHFQFLTLSTCRSWLGRDKRLLVVAARGR